MEAVQTTARDFEGNGEAIEFAIRRCERSAGTMQRSFFVKKLEQHLLDKGVNIPNNIFDLFDTPFNEFTVEFTKAYEHKVKGQALFHIFSDMLVEIFESLNADRIGWGRPATFLGATARKG